MSKVFTASRLSDGNKVFPARVEIDEHGVTVTIPGLFNNQSVNVSYDQLPAVKIDTPLIGYSRIYFNISGRGNVSANGFTKAEVTEMRDMIQQYKSGEHREAYAPTMSNAPESDEVKLRRMELEAESDEVKLRRMELESEKLRIKAANTARADEEWKNFYGGLRKFFKFAAAAFALLIAIGLFRNCLEENEEENDKKDAAAYNIRLEQLNDSIQIMIDEHQNRAAILAKINRLVHPIHMWDGSKIAYYDEYWNKVREERRKEVLQANEKPEPDVKSTSTPNARQITEQAAEAEETQSIFPQNEPEQAPGEQAENTVLEEEPSNP